MFLCLTRKPASKLAEYDHSWKSPILWQLKVASLSADLASTAQSPRCFGEGFGTGLRHSPPAEHQSRHPNAKPVETGPRWGARRGHPEFLLFGAEVIAQIEVHMAFEVVHLVAERRQFLLQSDARVARDWAVVDRPSSLKRLAPSHAVSEVTDRNRVGVRVVVLDQRRIVLGDDEGGTLDARREEQDSLAACRERLAVGAANADLRPFVIARVALHGVKAVRHHDFKTPRQAGLPMILGQVIAGRGNHVRHVAPDVALAIAGEIDSIVDHVGWHKLGLAQRAGP